MPKLHYLNEEFELTIKARQFIMRVEITGYSWFTHSTPRYPSEGGIEHVNLDITDVQEWMNEGEYLEPVTDEQLLKEIELHIDSEQLLEDEGEEC